MRSSFQIPPATHSPLHHQRTRTFDLKAHFTTQNNQPIPEYQIPLPTILKDTPLTQNNKNTTIIKPKLNKEFLKELTKIYDSNTKTSRTCEEYEAFFKKEAKNLTSNLKSINSLFRKEVSLSTDGFFSEHIRISVENSSNNKKKSIS